MNTTNPDISVIIPVYNSQDCLNALHTGLTTALQNTAYEIIFINDGSTDQSWQTIKTIAKNDIHVKAINFSKNFGQNNAILAGIKNCNGNYAVIMDDDLQHNPKDIFLLVDECKKGADVCFAKFKNLNQKVWKNAGSNMNGKIAEWFINKPKDLYLSPFKAIRKNVIESLQQYNGAFPYIDSLILQITNSFAQITVEHHARYKGKSNYTFFKSLGVFFNHAFSYSIFPLKVLTWIGFFSTLLSVSLGVWYLIEYFTYGNRVEGWMTITLLLLFFGGLILASLGIIGNYLARMYKAGNFSVTYSIQEKINL